MDTLWRQERHHGDTLETGQLHGDTLETPWRQERQHGDTMETEETPWRQEGHLKRRSFMEP